MQSYPGMRATQANASAGASFPGFKALFETDAKQRVKFQPFVAEAFDSVFVAFLAALEAGSSDPAMIAQHIVSVTNPPGEAYSFQQLDQAINAALAGRKIRYEGASGPMNFVATGRVSATAYDIWQVKTDGSSSVVETITFRP